MRKALILLLVCIIVMFSGCVSTNYMKGEKSTSPQEDLIGYWVITSRSGCPECTDYYEIRFFKDDRFFIVDEKGTFLEKNDMTEVSDSSFVGNIRFHSVVPSLEGGTTYARYGISELDGVTYLKLEFYSDASRQQKFLHFFCEKIQ